jgi:ATP-dependent helicase/nuclease subunit B
VDERVIYISGKSEAVFERILDLCPWNDYSSVLYLCPNYFILREANRDFFQFLKGKNRKVAFIPFRSFTLKTFASGLQGTSNRARLISEEMRVLILSEITGQRSTGYSTQLSELLRKIRHYLPDFSLSRFRDHVRELIFEERAFRRLDDAIEVLERYEEEIKRRGLIDVEVPLKEVLTSSSLTSYEMLVIQGFYDPTPLELSVLKRVIENSKRVYIFAGRDTGLLNFLLSQGMEFNIIEPPHRKESDRISCHRYRTMEDEVEGIARQVKSLILQGVRPWRIIITFPRLRKYLPMLKRIFNRYEIPLDIGEYDLTSASPLIALENMLTSIEEDYPRTEFLSFLTSPCFPRISDTLKKMSVPYSYKARVIKGKSSWLTLRDSLIAISGDEMTDMEKEMIKEFGREMVSIIEILEGLKNSKGLISFMDSLESILERFGFLNFLKELDENIYSGIGERFTDFRRFALLYDASKYEPWFYLRQFLKEIRLYLDDDLRGVRALPYELAASLEADVLLFGGLIEEDFPSRPAIDPYLPESVKRQIGMPDLEYYIDRQRRYFKRLLEFSSGRLCLSYPSGEEDKPHLPSPFLDWEMITEPEEMNIFSKEDVLIAEGSLSEIDVESKILWDGGLSGDKKLVSLLKKRTEEITGGFINVTDIDSFRRCPLRFYIEKVLGLEMLELPRYEVEKRLWGSLAHKVMENLYRDKDFDLMELEDRLKLAIEDTLRGFPLSGFWARVAGEIFMRRLPLLRIEEDGLRREGFIPYRIEERITAEVDGLRLKGKIDRIDKRSDNSVMLLDYKTGMIDNHSLQLPLYAYMWQKVHGETVERTGFYSLKDVKVISFPKKATIDEFISEALERLRELVKIMRQGEFPPAPEKSSECRFCYNSALCAGSE